MRIKKTVMLLIVVLIALCVTNTAYTVNQHKPLAPLKAYVSLTPDAKTEINPETKKEQLTVAVQHRTSKANVVILMAIDKAGDAKSFIIIEQYYIRAEHTMLTFYIGDKDNSGIIDDIRMYIGNVAVELTEEQKAEIVRHVLDDAYTYFNVT